MDVGEAKVVAGEIATKIRSIVPGIEPVRDPSGKGAHHALWLAETIVEGISEGKTMRWLGYVQAMMVYEGLSDLASEKERSRAAVHGARDATA